MAMYEQHNNGKIPFAFIHHNDQKHTTWDHLVNPFIRSVARGTNFNAPPPSERGMQKALLCPSDKIPPANWAGKDAKRRTYAMPWHNMFEVNWPPAPDNATGVGLWWANYGGTHSSLQSLSSPGNHATAIYKDIILQPAATMLLTEQAKSGNIAGNSSGATIRSTADHLDAKMISAASYHDGKFNYLQFDGHVKKLYPKQTVGHVGSEGSNPDTHFGLWTIRPGD